MKELKISIIYHSDSEDKNTEKMALLIAEGCAVDGITVKCMTLETYDKVFMCESQAIIIGTPNWDGTCCWQIKRFLDTELKGNVAGKLGAVFVSQNEAGGGGSFVAMSIIAAFLIHSMLVYSGGMGLGRPFTHLGAISTKAPVDNDRNRCLKLGRRIADKVIELFGKE
jgi:NAD(P)H dehydrogenase (quinone)